MSAPFFQPIQILTFAEFSLSLGPSSRLAHERSRIVCIARFHSDNLVESFKRVILSKVHSSSGLAVCQRNYLSPTDSRCP